MLALNATAIFAHRLKFAVKVSQRFSVLVIEMCKKKLLAAEEVPVCELKDILRIMRRYIDTYIYKTPNTL